MIDLKRKEPQPQRISEGLIVSHGSPSEPEPQERFIQRLAERVSARTGWCVRGATLANPDALDTATRGMTHPWIFPHFMSDGWFVTTHLQNRLKETHLHGWEMLTPLGFSNALPALALRHLEEKMISFGLQRQETTLLVAAHGSPSHPRPAATTRDFADKMKESGVFLDVRLGFVDETPSIEESAIDTGPAIVLPFFAAQAGHVLSDLPNALASVDFKGPVLPPIGTWDAIPLIITEAFQSHETSG